MALPLFLTVRLDKWRKGINTFPARFHSPYYSLTKAFLMRIAALLHPCLLIGFCNYH